jgi:hypothetical protein
MRLFTRLDTGAETVSRTAKTPSSHDGRHSCARSSMSRNR